MCQITINGETVNVAKTSTILQAARQLGITIPTLCYLEGLEPFTSCMLCVVKEQKSGKLLPSCSARVQEGMIIETDSDEVQAARRDALELLLSEHIGDCEAPCQKGCPAHMNIPQMLRQIAAGELDKAILTIKKDIALPAVLGRICPAPCEKVCNRAKIDEPVSICLLKRYAADANLDSSVSYIPASLPLTGKRVAIIGSGPTGLAAAFHLLQYGHACDLYDQNEGAGGTLRYGVDPDKCPASVLDSEIAVIAKLGARFILQKTIGKDIAFAELRGNYDAVVLATGVIDDSLAALTGVPFIAGKGFAADAKTFVTGVAGVFAGGSAVRESRMAIRSVAQGKTIAYSIHLYLQKKDIAPLAGRFNSSIGKLTIDDLQAMLKLVNTGSRKSPADTDTDCLTAAEAVYEASRCLRCDCRKPEGCKLRQYSEEYNADQKHYPNINRKNVELIDQHNTVIYEPGKCIKCGICVQITERSAEKLGLTFIGRGFNVRIGIPFNSELAAGLSRVAEECVLNCPTGALAHKKGEEKQ
ncbi:MAG TPA: 2Fe-2S iron-sulfur cluster-binding protein [bacterium]|nr:2Fe-2S iron-sulfur cluster-binding protein [bacterium]HPN43270.1 2Fe-2S iron-sulfur cluster-binding protein [bacterium]